MLNSPQTVLSVADAHVSYDRVPALRGLSLELFAGELLGLLGPNGAGKTTLIRSLAGRRTLDAGAFTFHLAGQPQDFLGIVPQEIALYSDLTVRQNLVAFGKLQGISPFRLRERVQSALYWAQLEDRKHSLAKKLSGGMQRRLNIACSVLHQPRILLLDEPTVGVDPQSRERIYEMLDGLLEHGTAILLTTHQLEEAQDRCDRIAIMDDGRILESGPFEELVGRTIGTSQQVSVRFSSPQTGVPAPLALAASGMEATCQLASPTEELPGLLDSLNHAGAAVEHLTLREPTLQHMFLHLTGKELRE